MRLNRAFRAAFVLLAVCMLSGLTAVAAHAEEAPLWSVEYERLEAGETRNASVEAYGKVGAFALQAGTAKVSCPSAKLKEGHISGSSAGNPGTASEVIEFSGGCTTEGNGSSCKVKEPVTTSSLSSELVESGSGEAKSVLMGFKAASGNKLMTLKFEGSSCTLKETSVTGEVYGEVLGDPGGEKLGEKDPLPNGERAHSWLINFPSKVIEKVWLVKEGTGSEVKPEALKAFLLSATLTGTETLSLTEEKEFGMDLNAIAFRWIVGTMGLSGTKEIETSTISSETGTKFNIEGEAATQVFKLECGKVKGKGTSTGYIKEGAPGLMKLGEVEMESCTVTAPIGCTINTPIAPVQMLSGIIVEGVGMSSGRPLVNLTVFGMKFEFENIAACGMLKGRTVSVEGNVSAQWGGLIATQKMKFEPTTFSEYKTYGGAREATGLRVSTETANRVRLSGTLEVILKSKEAFTPI